MANIDSLPNELINLIGSYLTTDEKYNQHYKYIDEFKQKYIINFQNFYFNNNMFEEDAFITYKIRLFMTMDYNNESIIKYRKFNNECKFIKCCNRYSFLDEYNHYFNKKLNLCTEYNKTIKRNTNLKHRFYNTYVSKESYYSKIRDIKEDMYMNSYLFY